MTLTHPSSHLKCDGPECRVFASWDEGWDFGAAKDYMRLEQGSKELHFCSVSCLAKYAVNALHEELLTRVDELNAEHVTNYLLRHPERAEKL